MSKVSVCVYSTKPKRKRVHKKVAPATKSKSGYRIVNDKKVKNGIG